MANPKLWDKGIPIDEKIEKFTIGNDNVLDLQLAEYDVLGSLAHTQMLHEIGVIKENEYPKIKAGLLEILRDINSGNFAIKDHVEDVHSQVEMLLIDKVGKIGGKIHTGRSRNDQVLVDLKLFYRAKLNNLGTKILNLSKSFLSQAEANKEVLMPGYTHTQVAMTSSFGMWYGAFGEALYEDAQYIYGILPTINKNPLGSAAGYGSSFPLNRSRTTELLGFDGMHYNPINAQYGRGKSELIMTQSLAPLCMTLNKLSNDLILYSNENYRFLSLPKALTTGSSIMPHKKNPDVFELIRAHSNSILNLPNEITLLISNLTTGYHRDFQLLKEILFPAFEKVEELIDLVAYTIDKIQLNKDIIQDEKYDYLLTVDAVNELVKEGMPFREAYLLIGKKIENGHFEKPKKLSHTHEGSIGNLCLDKILQNVNSLLQKNPYQKIADILSKLTRV